MCDFNQLVTIGKQFAECYYKQFDTKATRAECVQFYADNIGMLTFEGDQFQGKEAIKQKLESFPLADIARNITSLDVQPLVNVNGSVSGLVVFVSGQLKNNAEGDKPMGFSQVFVLTSIGDNYYLCNDMFRLSLHNF